MDTDEVGYLKTIPGTSKTKVSGIFACGDVQDPHFRQVDTAAEFGFMAAIDAESIYRKKIRNQLTAYFQTKKQDYFLLFLHIVMSRPEIS